MPPLNDLVLTPVQAAEHAGVSDVTIRWWIREGKLRAEQVGANRYLIYVSDLERYLKLRRAAKILANSAPRPTPEQAQAIRDALPPVEPEAAPGHQVLEPEVGAA